MSDWKTRVQWWVVFARNAGALAASVGLVLYAVLTNAMDNRYASADLEQDVERQQVLVREVTKSVDDLRNQIEDVRTELGGEVIGIKSLFLRDRLFELRVKQCLAESADSKRFYAREIQEGEDEYRRIAHEAPPEMPRCDDLR